VFDLAFHKPVDAPQDEALLAAARRFHQRVAVAGLHKSEVGREFTSESVVPPFPLLAAEVSWGLSLFHVPADIILREPDWGPEGGENLAVVAIRMLGGNLPPQGLSIWLNYYGPPGRALESVSYADVVSNSVPAQVFSNRVVVVGSTYQVGPPAGPIADMHATPYTHWSGRLSSGVEVLTTTILNFLRGDWLRRLSGWTELVIVIALGLLASHGLCRLRPLPALVAATSAGIFVAVLAIALMWSTRVWFPWLIVSAVQLPVALAWSALASANTIRGRPPQPARTAPAVPGPVRPVAGETSASVQRREVLAPAAGWSIPNYQLLLEIGRGAHGQVWLKACEPDPRRRQASAAALAAELRALRLSPAGPPTAEAGPKPG